MSSLRLPENGVLPWFEITVGEPQKIGDVISPHIVYKVHIRVCLWETAIPLPPKQTADGEHETNGIATSLSNRQTLLLTSRMILQCRGDTGTFCGFTTS